MYPNPRYQRGIGLPAAIFVITLMVGISVAINQLVTQNSETFEEEVLLTRAFFAAESGAGFAMNILFPPVEYDSDPQYATGSCPDTRIYEFTVDGLSGCRAEVSCELDASVDEVDYYTITSEGVCGAVSRTVQVRTSFASPD